MFKKKVHIILRSGEHIYLRTKDIYYDIESEIFKIKDGNLESIRVRKGQIDAVIVVNWWQRWV